VFSISGGYTRLCKKSISILGEKRGRKGEGKSKDIGKLHEVFFVVKVRSVQVVVPL